MRALTIIYRHCFFPLCIALLINDALVQCVHRVHTVAGQTVILPCYRKATPSAYWRYNDSRTVCDIIEGEVYFDEQHSVYKDKVGYFSEELQKGNFSIKLLDVNSAHQGTYTCNFPETLIPETIYLTVKVFQVQCVHLVNGTLGRSVILPCTTSEVKTNVYWRFNASTTVCDIIDGKADFEEQHVKYKGRVETFQTEFPKGNFSIKLNNLMMFDAGIYTCNFPSTLIPVTVHLKVIENGSESLVRRSDSLLLCLLGYMLLSN
ncbi:butyrophilin-like protein 10 isoform X1 [Tachysurus ichikawai]